MSIAAIAALVLRFESTAIGSQVVFGLDDRPSTKNPPDTGFGNGAEDPYGLVSSPNFVGPSPSLNVFTNPPGRTLTQADILKVGNPNDTAPIVDLSQLTDTNYIDEISSNRAPAHGRKLRLAFSVDRASVGVSASAVHTQFLLNQQPGDIFLTNRDFPAPSQFVGTLGGFGWVGNLSSVGSGNSNVLLINQSSLKLTAGMGPGNFTEPTDNAQPITPGSHDNVDAFDMAPFDTNNNLITNKQLYFTVNPDQPASGSYNSAADIYRTPPGLQSHAQFAQAYSMGLDFWGMNSDDIDGLELYDRGVVGGVAEPGIDYALFSLAPGSQSLQHFSGITAADVFFTDFQYSFATYARDADLGLSGTKSPAELGGPGSGADLEPAGNDNVDALGSYPLGDMDWNGNVDVLDIDDFVQGLTRPNEYRDADGHNGYPATVLGDFSVPRDGWVDFDDVVPFRNAVLGVGAGAGASSLTVPEPCVLPLVSIAPALLAGWRWARHSRRRRSRELNFSERMTVVRSGANAAGRTGYTLVELLVVVAIISILMAILMPAIQAAREAARSAQCADHLKQLITGLHGYHSAHNRFPPGSTLASKTDVAGNSWHTYSVRYLEEQETAERILKYKEPIAPPIPLFFCPSDPVVIGGVDQLHITNYYGSGGAGTDSAYVIDLEKKFCGDVYTDGILFPMSKTTSKSITDGLTHTLAIGERVYFKHIWTQGAFWVGSATARLCTESSKNVRWPINSPAATSGYYVFDTGAPASMRTMRMNDLYFGSRHPGGAWFAFAGGNVQFIANDIAFSVYQDLATRNGGEALSATF